MSLMKDRLRNLMRSAKNSIKDYSPAERRVRAATSNEPWPPSSRMMIVICRDMTDPTVYDSVLVMILKRLQDKGQVMHVRKSLQLVEFCLRHGNSRFVEDMKTRRYIFKGLQTYRFLVHGQDKGAEVRSKAERIMNLLADDSRLEQERLAAKRARSRMQGFSNAMVKNPPMNFAHRSESDETSSPSETRKERHPRETTLATLPSPSTQTSTSDDTSSSSFSDSTESKKGLKPLEPPRKKLTGKKAKAGISDSAASQNRGGHPAIPDNPFDPLSTMFDVKSADDRELFDWIPPSNENNHGNTASQAITKTAKANGGIVAALSHGGSDIKMGPPANVAATSLPMDIDSMLMTDVAVVPKQDAPFAHPEWYQIQPFRPMPMQHQHLPLYAHRVAPNRTVPFLALPPPTAEDSQNPFL